MKSPRIIQNSEDDISLLLAVLPEFLLDETDFSSEDLLEIVMDLGRRAEARYPNRIIALGERVIDRADLEHVLERVGEFTDDNRAGIERTLHRISAMRNRHGAIVGLTLRVGRAVFGTVDIVRDLLESGRNILLLGRPGVGKTTLLREAARVLADQLGKRVIVVDTSNEIAGDGDIPHPGIGAARRMQVPRPERQHAVMIEAVENHMPEVIVIDEIGTNAETLAARTIAERGVQLIGTVHGNTLENLVMNPTLSDLIGGVHTVTLSDEEARRRGSHKTISERRAPPTFDTVIEIVRRDEFLVHPDTADAVDKLLEGREPGGGRRTRTAEGHIEEQPLEPQQEEPVAAPVSRPIRPGEQEVRIYPYAISRELLERVIRSERLNARTTARPEVADLIVAQRSREGDRRLQSMLGATGLPLHLVKNNSSAQLRKLLKNALNVVDNVDDSEVREAIAEVEHAIERALSEKIAVPLAPRRPPVRKMQHRLVTRYHLEAQSEGREPLRHLIVHPPD
ncbi:R3H domain-containing nucleic acid-binding protein [Gilvimarinus sp. F26214L]|uniref:R3H domain-containing nucleic acid-binding protein n=1 Tax=Gilvimarinus sp. DZF01 TaxID=3461371 RepID=UPI0040465E34